MLKLSVKTFLTYYKSLKPLISLWNILLWADSTIKEKLWMQVIVEFYKNSTLLYKHVRSKVTNIRT